ncbi:MAG: hypothetical protein KZQ85_08850 [Candidatus Thiodiazotropha sp. (ex Myrtea sp. 'scaly one' KF741663)]|nr:hypothetical protein [Candidatus Thiodiazotropha sp. (ex Myrtea sp. 'scaly one' KF741663)]
MRSLVALTALFGLSISTAFGDVPTSYVVNSCNFAPYSIDLHWVLPNTNQFGRLSLGPGVCTNINPPTQNSKSNRNIRFYAEAIPSDSFNYLKEKSWYTQAWNKYNSVKRKVTAQWPAPKRGGLLYCADPNTNHQYPVNKPDHCDQGKSLRLYTSDLRFGKTGRADWVIVDFAVCDKLTDFDCYNKKVPLEELRIWAIEMSHALKRLKKIDSYTYEKVGLIPTHAGLEVRDTNRMFNEGVEVTSALKSTPFGTPIQIQKGDEILSFNGHKVFGRDLIMLVFEAGRRFGYHHANDILFRRDGEVFSTKIALYFDPSIYGSSFQYPDGSCRMPFLMGALSALNEFLFYTQTTASCLNNGLTAQQYDSFDQCKFERDQLLAAGKQFCPKAEYTGALIGGLSFVGRNILEKAAIKHIPGIGGKKLYSRIKRAALLEVAEESVRAALTQPPGLRTKEILNDIVKRGKLQGVIGVGFQVAPLVTAGALVPIVYNTYQDL